MGKLRVGSSFDTIGVIFIRYTKTVGNLSKIGVHTPNCCQKSKTQGSQFKMMFGYTEGLTVRQNGPAKVDIEAKFDSAVNLFHFCNEITWLEVHQDPTVTKEHFKKLRH